MNSSRIKKTVLIVGYTCNNNCIFCCSGHKRKKTISPTETLMREMAAARDRGATYLEMIGGEVTIRPDIIPLVSYAKSLGFKSIVMATNGRMLAYPEFAKKLLSAGLTDIVFSIHGHTSLLHDHLTRVPGSFLQLCQGLDNVRKIGGCRIASNTTVICQNYKKLEDIGRFIAAQGIRNSEFINIDPTHGYARENFSKLVPKISHAAPYMRACLDIGKLLKAAHWHVRYVPLCHFVGYESQISELAESKHFETEHFAPDFINRDVQASRGAVARQKTARCQGCLLYSSCEGLWVEYLQHYGDDELQPLKGSYA